MLCKPLVLKTGLQLPQENKLLSYDFHLLILLPRSIRAINNIVKLFEKFKFLY